MIFKKTSMALIASALLATTLSARDQIKIVGSSTVYPFSSCDGTKGYLSCRRKASKDEIEKISKLYEVWINEEKK